MATNKIPATTIEQLIYGLKNGDIVFQKSTGDEFLCWEQDGESYQIWLSQRSGSPTKEGWTKADGTPEDGVTEGIYILGTDAQFDSEEEAYWQKNTDVLTPYEVSDFEFNGSFFMIR